MDLLVGRPLRAPHAALPVPGILLGPYPESVRDAEARGPVGVAAWRAIAAPANTFRLRRYRAFAAAVAERGAALAAISTEAMDMRLRDLRADLSRDGFAEAGLVEAFALVGLAARRALGHRPFDTQVIAARIMFDRRVAEMATGEGKTLAAALCAAAGALAGVPVHVVTVNDYLVARDAALMTPMFAALGLSVGHVVASDDVEARRRGWACDVTYCTAQELVFDYLRDRTVRDPGLSELHRSAAALDRSDAAPPTLLRGLCMAVVDEVDSILIDEARIPLVLSAAAPEAGQAAFHAEALTIARQLVPERDFLADPQTREVTLTEAGRAALEAWPDVEAAAWLHRMQRDEAVCTALAALHVYRSDLHYLVRDGKVHIIDDSTGRLAPGRAWSRGLHQMIELKEGCETSAEQVTASQITYQRFFRRYLHLGGMSGTVREARAELASVYGLDVVTVPLRRPDLRRMLPARLFRDHRAQWLAVIARTLSVTDSGRPVLIGTDSVAASESLGRALAAAGIAHTVLNARNDALEASIVAQAGDAGRVTVATNMAGRGTDIPLAPGVADRGGLHVISCQHNASRRIDRQLIGRCARQGDPGSAETLLALDAPRLAHVAPQWLVRRIGAHGMHRPSWLVTLLVRLPQWREERAQRAQRRALLARDDRTTRSLSVFGGLE
jgi:preprotein translocase subunit SecA